MRPGKGPGPTDGPPAAERQRVLFFGRPDTLDPTLEFTRAMSTRTEFHLLLEVAPAGWSPIASPPIGRPGVQPAGDELRRAIPDAGLYLDDVASCRFIVYRNRRRIHPATLPTTAMLLRYLRRLAPDVLHLDNAFLRTALLAPAVPRIHVMTVHDPAPHRGERRWQTGLARRLLFPHVERFLVHSSAMREVLCDRYGIDRSRVDVVHFGPFDVFRLWGTGTGRRDDRTVLFLGRLSRYKGLEVLAQAAPMVAARVPGVRFLVAGPTAFDYRPPPSSDLPRGGTFSVRVGRVPNEELARLASSATLMVCPYRDGTQSGVVMTAYAFRTPVVATRVGGLPEYVEDGRSGLLVPPDDPAALADALVRVLTEPGLAPHLQDGIASLTAGRLSWDRAAEGTLDAYRRATR